MEAYGRPLTLISTTIHEGVSVETYQDADGQWFFGFDEGRASYLNNGTEAKCITRAKAIIDTEREDDRIYSDLVKALRHDGYTSTWATPESVQAGQLVALYSRGKVRPGIVTKVTKNGTGTATVAYITRGGLESAAKYNGEATITRKSAKVSELLVHTAPEAPAPEAQEATPEPAPEAETVAPEAPAQVAPVTRAATITPEFEELVRAFYLADAKAAGEMKGHLTEAARQAYGAMMAACPHGVNTYAVAKGLGLVAQPQRRGRRR
jgi:hypothetical protein